MASPRQRRFFILDETIPASEVPSMMCRVVVDKLRPQSEFAPFTPVGGDEAGSTPHGTDAIIPDICPEPQCSHDHRESLWRSGAAELDGGGGGALHASLGGRTEARFELHARLLRRYALPNPERCFARLMRDARYAADVAALLRAARGGRAYLVTGFMTATDAVVKTSSGSSRIVGASASSPGAVLSGGGASLKHAVTVRAAAERERRVVGEEIFAVAYSAVRLSRVFDAAAPRFHRVVPVIGPPKRSKARHLALVGGDDDSEEEVELGAESDLDFYSDTETVGDRLGSRIDDAQPSVDGKEVERVCLVDDPVDVAAAELSILWEPSTSGSF